MTRNPKPDELPADLDDVAASIAPPLVLDVYLSRQGVLDRIVDTLGVTIEPTNGHLTHLELAAVLRAVDPDERRQPRRIRRETAKYDIILRLGDLYGFPTADDQDTLRKSQLVFILLAEGTGSRPSLFCLPSDPDSVTQTAEQKRRKVMA